MSGNIRGSVKTVSSKWGGFRPEIEGLRALAIGSVLLYHAGFPIITGGFIGVDVFFVISGFLITGHIVREITNTGRLSLFAFWGRRAKRLIPAALTVFIATAVAAWIIVPNTSWRSIGADIAAASAYLVNWRFAGEAVDYNAEGSGASPVLHFWSLSIEEQFYILWPILLALVAWVILRKRTPVAFSKAAGIAIALIAVPSFIWSVYYTGVNPDGAFFVTTTRLWELGVGSAVALGMSLWSRVPPIASMALGWLGLAAVLYSAVAFNSSTPWPGYAALVPVLGTAAVIIASSGEQQALMPAAKLLSWRPLVWMGALSYSWYLWHWPVLVLAEAQWGELRLRYSLMLVLASGVLAWLSLKFIENPIRRSKSLAISPKLALSFGLNLSLVGVVLGLVLSISVPQAVTGSSSDISRLGANVLELDARGQVEPYVASNTATNLTPSPADALTDFPDAQIDGCIVRQDSAEVKVCEYGDPNGALEVAIVGDSKMQQWEPAISAIAKVEGWRVTTYLKSACSFAAPRYALSDEQRRYCAEWNTQALGSLIEAKPDVVITSGRGVFDGNDPDAEIAPGAVMIADWWQRLQDAGIRVVPLLDNPDPGVQIYECVALHPEELSACSFNREDAIVRSGTALQVAAADIAGIKTVVAVDDIVCPPGSVCPAVIGDVLVFRQGSHLTNTFVRTATELLRKRLVLAVEG